MDTPKETLKRILRRIHAGEDPDRLKAAFREVLDRVGPDMIGEVEQELVREGVPLEEIRRLCDVHLRLFQESIERDPGGEALAAWHPIHTFMQEHEHILAETKRLAGIAREIAEDGGEAEIIAAREVAAFLGRTEPHYVREENVLFPLLERHGVTEPPKVMWAEHNEIRPMKKRIRGLLEGDPDAAARAELAAAAEKLASALSDHFYKENNVLYKMALRVVEPAEWIQARREADEIGYCCYTPPPVPAEAAAPVPADAAGPAPSIQEGALDFPTGRLTAAEIEGILDALPVEITFVDRDDRVRFFNNSGERIFPRTAAIIGRTVQNCHPPQSLDVVTRIIEAFRKGEKDLAEFWIPFKGKRVYIRYVPVRDRDGRYLGVLEVTQDMARIRGLEGERRLLDWES